MCAFLPPTSFAGSLALALLVGRSDVIYCKGSESSCLSLSYPPIGIEAGRLRDWFDRQQYLQLNQLLNVKIASLSRQTLLLLSLNGKGGFSACIDMQLVEVTMPAMSPCNLYVRTSLAAAPFPLDCV